MAVQIASGLIIDEAHSISADVLEQQLMPGVQWKHGKGLQAYIATNVNPAVPLTATGIEMVMARRHPHLVNAEVDERDVRVALVAAKERILEKGWVKQWSDGAGRICLGTALNMRRDFGHTTAAQVAAMKRVAALVQDDIPHWNDAPDTILANVIAVLDVAILQSYTHELETRGAKVTP